MDRLWLGALVVASAIGCSGKRIAPAAPDAGCYGCGGDEVYAPNASFLIMTSWDATCEGGWPRRSDQTHSCGEVGYDRRVTCEREGGGGACTVIEGDGDTVEVVPTAPGRYAIAVTMTAKGVAPYHRMLGHVQIQNPDTHTLECTRPKAPNTVVVRIRALRGDLAVSGPTPTVTVSGTECRESPPTLDGDEGKYSEFYDLWCESVPEPGARLDVVVKAGALTTTHVIESCPKPD